MGVSCVHQSQYTSEAYKMTLVNHKVIQSMNDVGKCYDNARMESFFAILKKEKLYRKKTKIGLLNK